jgi:hypothetical protein
MLFNDAVNWYDCMASVIGYWVSRIGGMIPVAVPLWPLRPQQRQNGDLTAWASAWFTILPLTVMSTASTSTKHDGVAATFWYSCGMCFEFWSVTNYPDWHILLFYTALLVYVQMISTDIPRPPLVKIKLFNIHVRSPNNFDAFADKETCIFKVIFPKRGWRKLTS